MNLDWYYEYTKPRYFKFVTPSSIFEYVKFCPHQLAVPKGYVMFQHYDKYIGAYCDYIQDLYDKLDIVEELTEDEFNGALVMKELVEVEGARLVDA